VPGRTDSEVVGPSPPRLGPGGSEVGRAFCKVSKVGIAKKKSHLQRSFLLPHIPALWPIRETRPFTRASAGIVKKIKVGNNPSHEEMYRQYGTAFDASAHNRDENKPIGRSAVSALHLIITPPRGVTLIRPFNCQTKRNKHLYITYLEDSTPTGSVSSAHILYFVFEIEDSTPTELSFSGYSPMIQK